MAPGKYARLAEESLRENRPDLYRSLQQSGELQAHLRSVQQQAEEAREQLEADYLRQNPPPADYMARVAHLQAARQYAEEVVLHDLVLVPDAETEKAMQSGYTD